MQTYWEAGLKRRRRSRMCRGRSEASWLLGVHGRSRRGLGRASAYARVTNGEATTGRGGGRSLAAGPVPCVGRRFYSRVPAQGAERAGPSETREHDCDGRRDRAAAAAAEQKCPTLVHRPNQAISVVILGQ